MADAAGVPDGVYDVLVVDASREGPTLHLELTVVAGERKGDVIAVAATGVDRDEIDVLGLPATLTVTGGHPAVELDG